MVLKIQGVSIGLRSGTEFRCKKIPSHCILVNFCDISFIKTLLLAPLLLLASISII